MAYPVTANWLQQAVFIGFALIIAAALLLASYVGGWCWWLLPLWSLWLLALVLGWRQQYNFSAGYLQQQNNAWWLQLVDGSETIMLSDLVVLLDCQQIILVKASLRQQARLRPQWFWLRQRQAPQQWHLLRCALFSANCE